MTDLAEKIGKFILKTIEQQRDETQNRAKQLGSRVIALLCDEKVITYTVIRNEQIRAMYVSLRKQGMRAKDARNKILTTKFTDDQSREYYLLEKNLERILYPKKNIRPTKK